MQKKPANADTTTGYKVPKELYEFHKHIHSGPPPPIGFRFTWAPFVIEIQYMLDIQDPQNYCSVNQLLAFAVTTDGFHLLLNLNSAKLEIFQREFQDIDSLGLTLMDLFHAERYPLSKPKTAPR